MVKSRGPINRMSTKFKIIGDEPAACAAETKKVIAENIHTTEFQRIMNFSLSKEHYFQIDSRSILPDTAIDFGLFKRTGLNFEELVKADDKSPVVVSADALRNKEGAPYELVIDKSAMPRYKTYLDSLLQASHLSEDMKIKRKAFVLKENSKILVKDLFDNPGSGEKLEEVKDAVTNIINSLFDNFDMIYNMLTLEKYDYYTYTHSVDVAVLSTGLGVAIGLNRDDVGKLGIGTMLHDIGKTTISPLVLNKQGKLDDYEYRTIKEHVREGEKIMRGHKEIPEESHEALMQHHEKLSGSGYPNNLQGNEITLFGRIAGLADCYDALTTQRPYKNAFTPYNALEIISKERKEYDSDLLIELVKMMGKVKRG